MNPNEEKFPEGSRVRITGEYGRYPYAGAEEVTPIAPDFVEYHGREAVVASYADVYKDYIRIRFTGEPVEGLMNGTMLVIPSEIERV